MLPQIEPVFVELREELDIERGKDNDIPVDDWRHAYWDEWCLALFLKGVCLRFIAFPVRSTVSLIKLHQFLTIIRSHRIRMLWISLATRRTWKTRMM